MPDFVETVLEEARWQSVDIAGLAETACAAVLSEMGLDPDGYEIALLACDDARIAALNLDFREKPTPTNVLSWPAFDLSPDAEGAQPFAPEVASGPFAVSLGDMAIAYETCMNEATDQKKPFENHVTHLLVHGCLHLLGYDHVSDKDAARMEAAEVAILAKLGIADPY